MATHSSVLARRIPGMGEPGGLPSLRSHRVGHDCGDLAAAVTRFKLCSTSYKIVIYGTMLPATTTKQMQRAVNFVKFINFTK